MKKLITALLVILLSRAFNSPALASDSARGTSLVTKVGDAMASTPLSVIAVNNNSSQSQSCPRETVLTAVHACFLSTEQDKCISQMLTSCSIVDQRVTKLRAYLAKNNSPLVDYADEFVKYADKYELDWRLVVSISGVESTFGKHIPLNSYNAYGWANGGYKFTSWDNSIEHVTMSLRTKYIDRGYDTLPEISRIYCPPNPLWWTKVKFFMEKIEATTVESTQASNSVNFELSPIASK
jgi:hypothetical protein